MPKSKKRKSKKARWVDVPVMVTLVPPGQDFVDTPCCGRLHLVDFADFADVTPGDITGQP